MVHVTLVTLVTLAPGYSDINACLQTTSLVLLGLSLSLAQGSLPNILVHFQVDRHSDRMHGANGLLDDPEEESMGPPRGVGGGCNLVTACSNLTKSRLDKVSGVGDHDARSSDLGHGGSDEVAKDKLDIDTLGFKLGRERRAPVLEEGLATRVGGKIGGRSPASEGAHGEDETLAPTGHDRSNHLSGLQGSEAVDSDDILQLFW